MSSQPTGMPRRGLLAETARGEAFSDGVLAIVITLLVLDLHAPEERGRMLHQLLQQTPVYVAYLASFAYVGVIWVNHHQLAGLVVACALLLFYGVTSEGWSPWRDRGMAAPPG